MLRDQVVKRTSGAVASVAVEIQSEKKTVRDPEEDEVEHTFRQKRLSEKWTSSAPVSNIPLLTGLIRFLTSSRHFDIKTLLAVTALSFFTRFYYLTHPPQIVFDEAHFGRYATLYIKGTHFFDIHPPLGKLMFMAVSLLVGYDGHFDFHGSFQYDGNFYIAMRSLTATLSSLTAPVIYLTMLEMGKSNLIAAFTASLFIFDNCFLLEGKLILMDAHMIFFLATAYYFHKRSRNTVEYSHMWYATKFFCGVNIGLGSSVKWTALATVALIGIETLLDLLKEINTRGIAQQAKDWALRGVLLLVVPLVIYLIIWTIHFRTLYHSGPGDNMMPSQFLKRLEGNKEPENVVPFTLLESILYIHWRMYDHNKGITEPHMSMSSWWSWPVLLKGASYWGGSGPDGQHANIYLIGNPIEWWSALLFLVLFCFYLMHIPWRTDKFSPTEVKGIIQGIFLLAGYAMNLYAYILVPRVTFLYHYLPALFFGFLLEGVFLEHILSVAEVQLATRLRLTGHPIRYYIVGCMVALNVLTFSYFAPLTYGFPLSQSELFARRWLSRWA
eukprot:TRINITY_DN3983_c0_g1_i1.p1 TRINITY_DN3983_c0_g1~~TRINITY_DN3983_c0_g1_i1.p1  ORF type:complete len:554 (+),score=88.68 TRINITY_DN3983_c0_g1_i1:45-1706(+)